MAAINITEQAAAAAASFEVYNCHENHLLHLNLGAGVNRDRFRPDLPLQLRPFL